MITLQTEPVPTTLIHEPKYEEIEEINEKVDGILQTVNNKENVIIMGDFNLIKEKCSTEQ